MIDAVAVMIENFYKPELDAAHNHSAGQQAGPSACGVIIPETG
jgi:hypothetical protein